MDANEMGVLFAGISSVLAVLIYFTKNIKEKRVNVVYDLLNFAINFHLKYT